MGFVMMHQTTKSANLMVETVVCLWLLITTSTIVKNAIVMKLVYNKLLFLEVKSIIESMNL
jgi:hypothetical protein